MNFDPKKYATKNGGKYIWIDGKEEIILEFDDAVNAIEKSIPDRMINLSF